MLPSKKLLPTESCNCLSLPTKVGFFEKVPIEERKRLGATHIGLLLENWCLNGGHKFGPSSEGFWQCRVSSTADKKNVITRRRLTHLPPRVLERCFWHTFVPLHFGSFICDRTDDRIHPPICGPSLRSESRWPDMILLVAAGSSTNF